MLFFYCVFACSTRMSVDSIVIEIIILNIFNTVQLSLGFFFFPHERVLNISTTSFSGQCKHLLSFLQAKCHMSTLHCGIDIPLLFPIDCYCLNYFLQLVSILPVFMCPKAHVNHSCVSRYAKQSNYYANHRSPVSIDFFLYLHKWIVGLISYNIMLLQGEFRLSFILQKDPIFVSSLLRHFYVSTSEKTLHMLFNVFSPLFVKRNHIEHVVLFFRTKKALTINSMLEGKEMRI